MIKLSLRSANVTEAEAEAENRAFYIKMIGDYYRYMAENTKGVTLEDVKSKAKAAYEEASAIDL